jgi:hypothetical protein
MTGNPGKTATITAGTGLTIETTDAAAGGANIEILADGAVDITGEGISLNAGNEELTLNSGDGVDIAQAGIPTTVKGTLHVNDDVTVNTTLTVVGPITAPTFIGELNGTINTATTATTQLVGESSDKIATTAFVANGTATNVSGVVAVANGGTGATTAEVARNNLGLYTGVYSTNVTGAASITIPFGNILPGGVIPTTSNMIIFFSNVESLLIMQAFPADTNVSGTNDSFRVVFNASQTGILKISYYIAM